MLNGCRLIVNLTGVVVPDLPVNLEPLTLAMPAALTLEWLRSLNVSRSASPTTTPWTSADAAFNEMARGPHRGRIIRAQARTIVDLGAFRLAALTDLDNRTRAPAASSSRPISIAWHVERKPPLFAMINWGPEYEVTPGRRELH